MPMNRAEQKISFILKSQAFKETSVIHQVFTKDFGVMSIISKGSRAKKF
jgi:Recombination protein O N terminal.